MSRVRYWVQAIAFLAFLPVMIVWQLAANWIDRHWSKCHPHYAYGTHVWHRHSLLGHQWWTTHS